MNIGEVLTVTIIDDNHLGNGIAKIKDLPVFVRGALKDDIVKIKITGVYKKYLEAEIIEFENKSSLHQMIECPYYKECGGCDLLHIEYEREMYLKTKYIKKLFSKYDININYFDRLSYRNKITLHVKDNVFGFYKKTTNEIISISKCLLVSDRVNELINFLKEIDLSKITEITIREGNGLLVSFKGNVSNDDTKSLINYSDLVSIYENDKLIYGEKYLSVDFDNFKFLVNNNSFLQINTKCAISLYNKIKEYVNSSNNLLDLYCGSATIGIYLSDICKNITGIEINKDSFLCGKENLKENNIKNYNLILGDASSFEGDFDTIIVDPPRSGLSKNVISFINNSNSKKLIYVSCNPSTLKRDIDLLDYDLKEITCFNMFPGTSHVETVMILEKKDV